MRIELLELVAFGPFSGTLLDFGGPPGRLQLVYGPNEAGKSTTLRALVALLYGIPERTRDAHLHEMGKLRLRATLANGANGAGERLTFQRRKGRKQTLLDGADQPLDEQVLAPFLGGLDEGLFRQMFGLDHERLRLGAEALLEGKGDVGEGLFDAGTGARSIHSALASLREEADALYRPKGQRKLNQALGALRERQRERKQAMLAPQAFEEQQRAFAEAAAEREARRHEKRELVLEQERLELALRVSPLLSRREHLLSQQKALGEAPHVPPELAAQARALDGALREQAAEASRLDGEHDRVRAALEALPEPDADAPDAALLRELLERHGNYRAAERELPALCAELGVARRRTEAIRGRIGQATERAEADTARRARLRKTAEDLRVAEADLSRAELERVRAARDVREIADRLAQLGEPVPVEGLAALLRAGRHRELAAELARCDSQLARLTTGLAQGLAQLGGEARDASGLAGLALPPREEAEALSRALEALEAQSLELGRRADGQAAELAALGEELALLRVEGEPITEDDLREARAARDGLWTKLVVAYDAGALSRAALEAYEAAKVDGDRVADRLRVESGRAGLVAHKRARAAVLTASLADLAERRGELARERDEVLAKASALWEPIGLAGLRPRDALRAQERLEGLVSMADERGRTLAERESLAQAVAAWGAALSAHVPPLAGESLAAQVRRAEHAVASEEERLAQSRTLQAERVKAERALRVHEAGLSALACRVQGLREALAPDLSALGLSPALGAPETLACLDELLQLEGHEREAEALTRRIAALEAERAAFAAEVGALASDPALGASALGERLGALSRRAERARDTERDRARLRRELDALAVQRAQVHARIENDRRALQALLLDLGVDGLVDLAERELRAARSEELRAGLAKLEEDLWVQGGGKAPEELAERCAAGLTPGPVRSRLAEISQLREGLEEQIRDADQALGRIGAGLTLLRQSQGASEQAEEAEAALAHAQKLVRRYVELRLALSILTREVERYRAAHQGPLLARASALFPRLTLGRYRGLDVDYGEDDRPRLCALRDDGVRVAVEGLSDGTRDQLYLSLRVASVERFVERNPALPFVVDDVLLNFDDQRSAAALEVLGELASRTQVLFFTHHARLVELAERVLGPDRLKVHALGVHAAAAPREPAPRDLSPRDDGPLFAG